MDGLGEDGPEIFLGGGVEWVGGDQEHFVIFGKRLRIPMEGAVRVG